MELVSSLTAALTTRQPCDLKFAPQLAPAQVSLMPWIRSWLATRRMAAGPEKLWIARELFRELVNRTRQRCAQGVLRRVIAVGRAIADREVPRHIHVGEQPFLIVL